MDFEGKVLQISAPTSGTSARGPWQRQEVLFEQPQEFSRKIVITFFNKPEEVARLKVGETYTVSINIDAREYNGRWYNDIRAWRIQPKQQPVAEPPMPDLPPMEPQGVSAPLPEVDDMPF